MHTKSLPKKSAMVYGSTLGDRKFHCIIGNHRYDFSQEIPIHIYCFVTELGLTQSLPWYIYKSRGCKVQQNITLEWGTFPDIRMVTDLVGLFWPVLQQTPVRYFGCKSICANKQICFSVVERVAQCLLS